MTACLHKRRAWLIMEWISHNNEERENLVLRSTSKKRAKNHILFAFNWNLIFTKRPTLKWHCKNHSHPFIQSDILFVHRKPNMSWQGKELKVEGMLFCSCFSRLCSLGKGNCLFYLPSPHLIQEAGPSPSHMTVREPMLRYEIVWVFVRWTKHTGFLN